MIGEKIRRLRERLKLSQEELSERARINRSYLSHIENGKSVPTIEVAERIARGLGVPLSELLSDAESPNYTYDTEEQAEMYEGLWEFLNDPDEILLTNPTPEEIEELKGIRFRGTMRPDKRFYRDALVALRRRRRSVS